MSDKVDRYRGVDLELVKLDAMAFVYGGAKVVALEALTALKHRDRVILDEVMGNFSKEDRKYYSSALNI